MNIRKKLKKIKPVKNAYDAFRTWSIRKGLKYKLEYDKISSFGIDITQQYTASQLDTAYLRVNVRALHAFQYSLAVSAAESGQNLSIIDIGDSNGTHCQYLQRTFLGIETLSVNTDKEAVKRIRAKGLRAIQDSIDVFPYNYKDDVSFIMLFEVLEHLENPIEAFMSLRWVSDKIILTVPYVKRSRIGMHHIRDKNYDKELTPENTHIFELSPEDWKLIFEYTGWKVVKEDIHYQYPRSWFLVSWLLKLYWRRFDFEGFYGVILERRK